MSGGLLPSIIFPSDVKAVQLRLKGGIDGTDAAVNACAAIDPAMHAAWESFRRGALLYCALDINITNTTGTIYDRGLAYERELMAWQKKIVDQGCELGLPIFDPTPPKPILVDVLMWTSIGAVALAGAYGVSKIVEFLPHWTSKGAGEGGGSKALAKTNPTERQFPFWPVLVLGGVGLAAALWEQSKIDL